MLRPKKQTPSAVKRIRKPISGYSNVSSLEQQRRNSPLRLVAAVILVVLAVVTTLHSNQDDANWMDFGALVADSQSSNGLIQGSNVDSTDDEDDTHSSSSAHRLEEELLPIEGVDEDDDGGADDDESGTKDDDDDETEMNAKSTPNTTLPVVNEQQTSPQLPVKVAYAISLIECTDNHKSGQSSVAGLQDASLVLRHSIHQNSIRNPESGSRYDYRMVAIIHEQAQACAPVLQDAGFETMIRPPPILEKDIQDKSLRESIHKEVCCGVHEFVKLYAYLIDAPVVVHLDIDFIIHKPMDALFDVMLNNSHSEASRALIEREDPTVPWPNATTPIDAMITRDYHSTHPGRNAGFQAGFWVLRPSQRHFDRLLDIIRTTPYVLGFERTNGWDGRGYGGFIGARAMQGLIAYYYDIHIPRETWIELNNCRYNAVQAVVKKKGRCTNGQPTCEDCRSTPIESIHSFHYTACRKPWSCIAVPTSQSNSTLKRKYAVPVDIVHYDQCMRSLQVWHRFRTDLETRLLTLTGEENVEHVQKGQAGGYNKEFFLGHCSEDQGSGYLRLAGGAPEALRMIPRLYDAT